MIRNFFSGSSRPPGEGARPDRLINCLLGIFIGFIPNGDAQAGRPAFDNWLFVNSADYRFLVPDKFQHFWGSYLLSQAIGPASAIVAGVLKEVYDNDVAGVGFSDRDLIANVLGVGSALLNRGPPVRMYLDWQPHRDRLVLVVTLTF